MRQFPKSPEAYIIAKQLIRSATSIGANVEEALSGFTKKDFIHKMSLALKECSESKYWIRLVRDTNIINSSEIDKILDETEEIRKILTSIIKTSQQNNG